MLSISTKDWNQVYYIIAFIGGWSIDRDRLRVTTKYWRDGSSALPFKAMISKTLQNVTGRGNPTLALIQW